MYQPLRLPTSGSVMPSLTSPGSVFRESEPEPHPGAHRRVALAPAAQAPAQSTVPFERARSAPPAALRSGGASWRFRACSSPVRNPRVRRPNNRVHNPNGCPTQRARGDWRTWATRSAGSDTPIPCLLPRTPSPEGARPPECEKRDGQAVVNVSRAPGHPGGRKSPCGDLAPGRKPVADLARVQRTELIPRGCDGRRSAVDERCTVGGFAEPSATRNTRSCSPTSSASGSPRTPVCRPAACPGPSATGPVER